MLACAAGLARGDAGPARAALRFGVNGADGGQLPCRIHFSDAAGKPRHPPGLPVWRDHFVCDGRASLELEPGRYRYEIERGPEYEPVGGELEVRAGAPETVRVRLKRISNLAAESWYCGDLHVHRPVKDVPLLMRAEDLYVAPVITWWNQANAWRDQQIPADLLGREEGKRFYHLMAGEDERQGGALLYFHLDRPLDITAAKREYPSPLAFVAEARRRDKGVWIDIEKPFWWDVPVWLASGQMDSIGLANNHMHRGGMFAGEAWGRPRDKARLPEPQGNGLWTQEIYYHVLNCGLRLPPSAGSASGVLPNPVGYNRVYVHVEGGWEHEKWWRGLKAGRSFVTNGPLLLCKADGHLPGHVFRIPEGERTEIALDLRLTSYDRVPQIEIVKDGRVEGVVELDESRTQQVKARVSFSESGWFLVRAIADHPRTFRFASTAPFYVEVGPKKATVRRASAQFFLDWAVEREKQVRAALQSPEQRDEVVRHHEAARRYFEELVARPDAR
jgi:hypothetical protein